MTVRKWADAVRPKLRALHVDTDRRAVRLVYDHTFRYDPERPPDWVRVQAEAGAP